MSESTDPRVLAAELEAEFGERAPSEALVQIALANGDGDHAALFRWEQVFRILMTPRSRAKA